MTKKSSIASLLNKQVALQALTETPDSAGGYSSSWETTDIVWAHIAPLGTMGSVASARERLQAMQLENSQLVRITLRYSDEVTAKMRIVMDSRVFNIRQVINKDEENVLLELVAEEGVAV